MTKLEVFLEKNPKIPRDMIFVDKPSFAAYKSMGIGKLFDDMELTKKGGKNFKIPGLTWKEWTNYFSSVSKISPDKDAVVEIGSQLGASYAVNGKDIVYFYEEGIPGDSPDPLTVIAMLTGNF